jgi:hypothetical protein
MAKAGLILGYIGMGLDIVLTVVIVFLFTRPSAVTACSHITHVKCY